MNVVGPILYLDEWTVDGRRLASHPYLGLDRPIPILSGYGYTMHEDHRILGQINEIDIFQGAVWVIGEFADKYAWMNGDLVYATGAVDGAFTSLDANRRIRFDGEWQLATVVVHGPDPIDPVWAGKETYLEEE